IVLCISGSVITESVFAIPGMGKMLPDSINLLNNNMVITLTFIYTSLSVFSLLIGDLLMTVVDPRIKLTEKGD
ncbi:MAG: ABC transporter permease subunit, partial [Erysipelotrichaceae bacterium]